MVWLNGNAYATWKLCSNFHFVWLEFEFFFFLRSYLFVSPLKYACGREIYVCIKPITSSDKMFKAIFHSFSGCCWYRTNKKNIYFLLVAWVRKLFPQQKPNRVDNFFFLLFPLKKVTFMLWWYRRYCCVIFCQFTTPRTE